MEYELTSSIDQGILEVTLTGKGGKEKAVEILYKISDLVKTFQPKSVLIDAQLMQDRMDLMDSYHLIHSLPPGTPHLKSAVVDRKENKEISDFCETVSENAGYIIRFFTDREAALTWLKS